MGGWPVWLASASLRNIHGKIRSPLTWDEDMTAWASSTLDVLLDGVGDPEHEREFVMCVTLCRHRALTQAEYDGLPDWWHNAPAADIAGGPIRECWSRGVPDTPATRPCVRPGRRPMSAGFWFPLDCGTCVSCLARLACRTGTPGHVIRPWP